MRVQRRALLETAATAALGQVMGGCGPERSRVGARPVTAALVRDVKGVLDLPEGFSYRIVQRSGDPLSDGYRVPGCPDAMGCFAGPEGPIVLMRNHEVTQGDSARSPFYSGQAVAPEAYDPEATGGVTRLVLDPDTLAVKSSNLVLAGTYWNCAGGISPWGWLSCEETVDDPRHGYVFLCATDADRVQPAQRIPGYGRMRHEAAAVDPKTLVAYLTEDRPDACFYRFVPDSLERPFEGRLQALRVVDRPGFDTSAQARGQRVRVDWVTVEGADSADDSLRGRARAQGAARFRRGEGLWLTEAAAYFSATAGGAAQRGQVFRLGLGRRPELEVIADGEDDEVLDMPDNLCVSPHGHIYVAEDGAGENFVRRIGLDGRVHAFARNALSGSEFAGPCFSPDGRTMFVNIQRDGLTLAVRGPFERPLPSERDGVGATHAREADGGDGRQLPAFGGLGVLALAALEWHRRRPTRRM